MRRTIKPLLLTLLILCAVEPLHAARARPGWTKLELSTPVSADLLARFDAELIADYGSFAIVYAPDDRIAALETAAARENVRVRRRAEMDVLQLPRGSVDARESTRTREYPAGRRGIYVVQLIGPVRTEWVSELQSLGWTLSRYVPNNGYLVVGTPELAARTKQLAFVQWLDVFHSHQKAAFLTRDGKPHDLLFELASGDDAASAIDAIRAVAEGEIRIQQTPADARVYARMTADAAEELLRHEMILSVSPKPEGGFSDERQVQSITSNLNAAQTQPSGPGNYWNWVLSRCTECATMPANDWKIGLADSGLDDGANAGHPDLAGRKFYGILGYTGTQHDPECASGQLLCDALGHGTLVAGIAVGNAAAGLMDSGGFLLGQGAAPTAGVFATKIFSLQSGFDPTRLFHWTGDAAANGVAVQNHSWNDYAASQSGVYSTVSRDFDIAARDADGSLSPARTPILLSVSSGNHNQGTQNANRFLTIPGATAKNILSMGGLENFRPGPPQCFLTRGDSFRNIMRTSRIGTSLAGYIKPDLMAPASLIVSAHTSARFPSLFCFGAFDGHPQYTGDSGTSFAAPIGSAASLIVKRYLGSTPASISPALTKAVLIAGARSVRGGEDRTHDTGPIPIGPIPSQQQGFGRLTLEDILNGSLKPVVFDQSPSRLLQETGETFSTTVRVRDATKPIKIALVWTDTPAMAFAPNPLVNDLNLEVRRSSDLTRVHVGNQLAVADEIRGEESVSFAGSAVLPFDNVNNVEFFRLFVNAGEDLTITVRAQNIAGDTDGDTGTLEQDFALAILNASIPCDPFSIAQHPQSQTISPGQTATLTVVVNGTGPFDFQWFEGPSGTVTTPVGTNSSSFTTPPLNATKQYWVRVTKVCDGTQLHGNTATITVQCTAAPSITTQPASSTISPGQSVTLSVVATQAASFQWFIGTSPSTASPISGATGSSLTVSPASTTNYWVRVTNACGIANSATATICVLPGITAQPASQTITAGQSATLTVSATNAASFQWFQGTAPSTTTPVGTNSSSLTVSPAVTTNYWVRVTNACGFVNSTTATVTVLPPQITRIQTSFALANSQKSITANWTQPTQAGTFLVAVISGNKDPNGAIAWTAPAGWVHARTYEWNQVKASVYYLPNNAGARMWETFTVAAGFHDQTLYLLEYSGMLSVNALDRTAINGHETNNGFIQTGFTANTTQPKELVITVLSTYAVTSFSTVPADGYTEVHDRFIGNHLTTAMYEKITNAIGSYGHNATVGGGSAEWIGLVVTFRAANPN